MEAKPIIGFAGLGIMGMAMAKNAKAAGFPLLGYNRSDKRRQDAEAAGIKICTTPSHLASQASVVVLMVTNPEAVKEILYSNNGLFSTNVNGKTLIQMSTLDVDSTLNFSRDATAHGMKFLDCPVVGSKKQVEEAQLILLAGGEKALIDECEPFLRSVGKTIVHAGEVGKGSALKLCMNLLVAQMTTALCESVTLAKASEVNPEKIFEVLKESPALNCAYYQIKKDPILRQNFQPAFSLENMLKDVRFMCEAAKKHRLPLPVTEAVRYVMEAAVAKGFGGEDLTSLIKILQSKSSLS